MRFRIPIREQLCILVAITSLLALTVLSVSIWEESYRYIKGTMSKRLSVTADLKATQIAQSIDLYQDLVQAVSTRPNIQNMLKAYNAGNASEVLSTDLEEQLQQSLSGSIDDSILLQAAIFPMNDNRDASHKPIANTTGLTVKDTVPLPYSYDNGTTVYLGDLGLGYPPELYPNLTWVDEGNGNLTVSYEGRRLDYTSTLVLGPLDITNQSALISMTVPVVNNTTRTDVLGWLTVVLNARLLYRVANDAAGLEQTGEVLLIGPVSPDNMFSPNIDPGDGVANGSTGPKVWFILPPNSNATVGNRHEVRANDPYLPFFLARYPAAAEAYSSPYAGAILTTDNEEGLTVSAGYAKVQSSIVDWVVVFEESRSEVMTPAHNLRDMIIACVFSVVGAILVICFPLAHYAVKPIRALRTATKNSIMIYEAEIPDSSSGSQSDPESLKHAEFVSSNGLLPEKFRRQKKPKMYKRREFRIPEKVPDCKHLINDELSDLTGTFNEMSDELKVQYARLEERVKKRTNELEKSRDLARAADESKTLFIANVSHELRTPLNGIIGMCSVAIQEDDIHRIKQSLNIIYKSSDLLSHLLNDLLTFSRNSYGQQLQIEHGVFKLGDIGTQIISIFEKQAREKEIGLKVVFQGMDTGKNAEFDDAPEDAIVARQDVSKLLRRMKTNVLARGPADTGPLRDMILFGDKNRILQVLMNLVSNSLKFTPKDGQIEVRIKCKGFVPMSADPPEVEKSTSLPVTPLTMPEKTVVSRTTSPLPHPSTRQLKFDFEVEDTGPGVPEHLQQEIFKPFVQGDLSLSRKHGGTGLGLAICAQLATLMSGSIHLRSTVDIGSTFTFTIPLGYSKEKSPSLTGSLAPVSRRGSLQPASLTDSIDVLSTRSPRPQNRNKAPHPRSARNSFDDSSPTMPNNPRIVGFSSPFLTNGVDDTTKKDGQRSPPKYQRESHPRASKSRLTEIRSHDDNEIPPDTIMHHDAQEVEQLDLPKTQIEDKSLTSAIITVAQSPATESPQIDKAEADSPKTVCPTSLPVQRTTQPRNMKILVAEDNKVNQEVIVRMLKLEKVADVMLAEDGVQAVKTVSESESPSSCFSLIFMDIQMPNMDGIEATKRIRDLGFQAPIIALTAFDHERNRDACCSAGMDDFVGKPLKRKALREVLEKYHPKEEDGEQ